VRNACLRRLEQIASLYVGCRHGVPNATVDERVVAAVREIAELPVERRKRQTDVARGESNGAEMPCRSSRVAIG
jgi:hypothetical protein